MLHHAYANAKQFTDAARALRDLGYAITWLDPGEKKLNRENWTLATQEPEDYRTGCNLGLMTGRLSDDLVCIDLDSQQAIANADRFLPVTAMVEGRPGKPRSHRYYLVTRIPAALTSAAANGMGGPRIMHFKNKDGNGIVDIFGEGQAAKNM